jgi:hypothetical protein
MLKFIEDDYHLPSLTNRDRNAASIASSFDFSQKPLKPLVLPHQHCAAGDYHIHQFFSGIFLSLSSHKYGEALLLRLPGGDVATLIIGPSTPIEGQGRLKVLPSDFVVGDHLVVKARPDPQRALVYGAGTIRDTDLKAFHVGKALIGSVGEFQDNMTVQVGKQILVVNLSKHTRVFLPHKVKGSLSDLVAGLTVDIKGVVNTRLGVVVSTSAITVVGTPHPKGKHPKP